MTLERMASFARRTGTSRSTVHRWREQGRLVMCEKLVDVEASLAILESTQGSRDDVARRHAEHREERQAVGPIDDDVLSAGTDDVKRQLRAAALEKSRSEARIKRADADMKEMQRDREAGDLLRKDDVDFVLQDFGATLRGMLEGRAERLGAELGLDAAKVVKLSESDEQMLLELAQKLKGRVAPPEKGSG